MTPKLSDASAQAEVDAAWADAIDRRLDELLSGAVKPVSGRETIAIARSRPTGPRE
jgi:hypothetical protein